MKMTRQEYAKLVSEREPRSPMGKNLLRAFLVGGLICTIGEAISQLWGLRLDRETAAAATSITLIALGAALTGFGVYDELARFAGAGTLVPITGFANSIAAPALEFRREGLIAGTAVRMFSIAGPVIVWGTCASVVYGLLLVLFRAV